MTADVGTRIFRECVCVHHVSVCVCVCVRARVCARNVYNYEYFSMKDVYCAIFHCTHITSTYKYMPILPFIKMFRSVSK